MSDPRDHYVGEGGDGTDPDLPEESQIPAEDRPTTDDPDVPEENE